MKSKDLVLELLGKLPVDRWETSKTLYAQAKLNAQFRLYPNIKHEVTPEIREDIRAFFLKHK